MRSIFIHVGTRKSGTTSLQGALRASREPLAAAGYALPLVIHDGSDRWLRRLKKIGAGKSRSSVEKVMRKRLRNVEADKVLISNEFLAELPQEAVDFFLDRVREHFDDARIVLIITARPWSKIIGSEWQERIKGRAKFTFADALKRIQVDRDPVFYARHDLTGIAERWGRTISPEDINVIAVPPPTSPGPGIFELYCGVLGLDPEVLIRPPVEVNQSLNPSQAELLRRINVVLGDRLSGKAEYRSAIRRWLVPNGFVEGRGNQMRPSGSDAEWCADQERRQVAQLGELGCRLIGDPADLMPDVVADPAPAAPTDADVADAAVQALAALAVNCGLVQPRQVPWMTSTKSQPDTVRPPMKSSPANDLPSPDETVATNGHASSDALDCKIARNRYGIYCVPSGSAGRPAAQAVVRGNVYEPGTIKFIRANCGDKDVIHAGTYFGDFLPALSSGLGPDALIWAFEPNRESYRCAEITLLLNRTTNVRLHNAGLGAAAGESLMQVANEHGRALGGASRIVDAADAGGATEPVSIVAIDEAVPADRMVGILHLDVEGFEQHALSGAFETIKRCRPVIILEQGKWNNFLDSTWFAENVLARGYAETDRFHLNRAYRPIDR